MPGFRTAGLSGPEQHSMQVVAGREVKEAIRTSEDGGDSSIGDYGAFDERGLVELALVELGILFLLLLLAYTCLHGMFETHQRMLARRYGPDAHAFALSVRSPPVASARTDVKHENRNTVRGAVKPDRTLEVTGTTSLAPPFAARRTAERHNSG